MVLSLALLSPAYYPDFFVEGKLTAAVGVSMMLGAGTAAAMYAGSGMHGSQGTRAVVRTLAILALASGVHAMLQGFVTLFAPLTWPGMMPPITLISFLLGVAAAAFCFMPKRGA